MSIMKTGFKTRVTLISRRRVTRGVLCAQSFVNWKGSKGSYKCQCGRSNKFTEWFKRTNTYGEFILSNLCRDKCHLIHCDLIRIFLLNKN